MKSGTEGCKGCPWVPGWGRPEPVAPPKVIWEWLLSPLSSYFLPDLGIQMAQLFLRNHNLAAAELVSQTPREWQGLARDGCGTPRILAGMSLNCQCIQHVFLPLSWQLRDLKAIRCLTWTDFQGSRAPASVWILQKHTPEWPGKVKLYHYPGTASTPSPGISGMFTWGAFVFLSSCLHLLHVARCLLSRLSSLAFI